MNTCYIGRQGRKTEKNLLPQCFFYLAVKNSSFPEDERREGRWGGIKQLVLFLILVLILCLSE